MLLLLLCVLKKLAKNGSEGWRVAAEREREEGESREMDGGDYEAYYGYYVHTTRDIKATGADAAPVSGKQIEINCFVTVICVQTPPSSPLPYNACKS